MADETNLIPAVDVPEFTEETDSYDTEYHPSIAWDLEAADFVRTPANRIPRSEGTEAYKVWCVKTVATERYSRAAYSDDIGTEMEDARTQPDRNAVELAIARTIQEALMVNPRTQAVENFSFNWDDPGDVHVTFTVTGIDEETFTLNTTIEAE